MIEFIDTVLVGGLTTWLLKQERTEYGVINLADPILACGRVPCLVSNRNCLSNCDNQGWPCMPYPIYINHLSWPGWMYNYRLAEIPIWTRYDPDGLLSKENTLNWVRRFYAGMAEGNLPPGGLQSPPLGILPPPLGPGRPPPTVDQCTSNLEGVMTKMQVTFRREIDGMRDSNASNGDLSSTLLDKTNRKMAGEDEVESKTETTGPRSRRSGIFIEPYKVSAGHPTCPMPIWRISINGPKKWWIWLRQLGRTRPNTTGSTSSSSMDPSSSTYATKRVDTSHPRWTWSIWWRQQAYLQDLEKLYTPADHLWTKRSEFEGRRQQPTESPMAYLAVMHQLYTRAQYNDEAYLVEKFLAGLLNEALKLQIIMQHRTANDYDSMRAAVVKCHAAMVKAVWVGKGTPVVQPDGSDKTEWHRITRKRSPNGKCEPRWEIPRKVSQWIWPRSKVLLTTRAEVLFFMGPGDFHLWDRETEADLAYWEGDLSEEHTTIAEMVKGIQEGGRACYHCNAVGHLKAQCPQWHQGQGKPMTRPAVRGQGTGRLGSIPDGPPQGRSLAPTWQ